MGLFTAKNNSPRYGVLVDIGSGSVLASIVASDPNKTHPEIIWSAREYTPFREVDEMSVGAKSIKTSLMNVFMRLDSEGRKVLVETVGGRQPELSLMQVTITSPWSYTVTKTITYQQDEEFTVSDQMIDELLKTAEKKVMEELKENEKMYQLDLSLVSRTTADVVANGYSTKLLRKQQAKDLRLFQTNAVAQNNILKALVETKNKTVVNSDLEVYSFMLVFFYVIKDLFPTANDYCLVDVTYEATELCVVRDGVLRYCTNIPFGAYSIAREISSVTSVPLQEAYNYLGKENMQYLLEKCSEKQKKEVEYIFEKYNDRLVDLFRETGDSLYLPKRIFLHSNLKTESFFKKNIITSAEKVTNSSHAVYNVSERLLTEYYSDEASENLTNSHHDTALLISAQFFHTKAHHLKFEQL